MTPLLVWAAFGLATLVGQIWIGRTKVQTRVRALVVIHACALLLVLAAVSVWNRGELAATLVFWAGAGLCWFVGRSHLESSILLAMLAELEAGPVAREELLGRGRTDPLDARIQGLRDAGLVSDANGPPVVTPRGRVVLSIFGWLGRR